MNKSVVAWSSFALLVGCGLLWGYVNSRHGVKEDLADISKMGIPTTQTELAAFKPKEGTNAAPYYAKFGIAMDRLPPGVSADLQSLSSQRAALTTEEQERIANEFRGAASLVIEGAKMERWPLDDNSAGDQDPGWIGVGLLGRMGAADDASGKTKLALTELHSALRMVDQANQNRNIDGSWHLYSTYKAYEKMIERHKNDPQTLQAIVQDLSTLPRPLRVKDSLVQLFMQDVGAYQEGWYPEQEQEKSGLSKAKGEFVDERSYKRLLAKDIALWKKVFRQLPADPYDREGAVRTINSVLKDAPPPSKDRWTSLHEVQFTVDDATCYLAEKRALTCAARVLLMKLKSGSFPAKLPDFGSDSIDPFTNLPLKYGVGKHGFVIYSVGSDRKDDSGTPKRSRGPGPGDIVYRF